ncbi:hypothetical protein HJC23_012358, partial [Cyclotella cryptica]
SHITLTMIDLPTVFPDITPIPQNEGKEPPVCSISYAPEFVQAHDYLRALLRSDERSQRALDLTTACLEMNPANYTVWHYRRRILTTLHGGGVGGEMDEEVIDKDLEFADTLGGTNPKNYQLWYHRRALLEIRFRNANQGGRVEAAQKELGYVDKILEDDSKNYHAWSHRQWIVRTVNNPQLWKSEVDYSHSKILDDPRNNSAWNQRWFATHEGQIALSSAASEGPTGNTCNDLKGGRVILPLDVAAEEAHYALCGAKLDPYNESPWRYLIGVLMEQWRFAQREGNEVENVTNATNLITDNIAQIREMKQSLEDQPPAPDLASVPCVSLISALVDLLEIFVQNKGLLEEASTLCRTLAEVDYVRRKYWRKREQDVRSQIETLN